MIMFIWIIVKAYLTWKIFCYNFSEHPMEQWTLCHLIVIHYRLNCLLEANPTIQQICKVVMTINICLLIFIAPINLRFLFDLIVRPNICLMCMYSIRNLKSRLVLMLSCSYVAYPIPTATLIRSAEIIIKRHRKKQFPIETLYLTLFLVYSLLLQAVIALLLLLASGDIELNPGPLSTYRDVFQISKKTALKL